MDTAEWVLVVILSVALLTFLIVGIVLLCILINLSKEIRKVVLESQDIARNTKGIVTNIRGMTSIGGTMELFIDRFVVPKVRDKIREVREKKEEKEREKETKGEEK